MIENGTPSDALTFTNTFAADDSRMHLTWALGTWPVNLVFTFEGRELHNAEISPRSGPSPM
jgi:hypothetical protein